MDLFPTMFLILTFWSMLVHIDQTLFVWNYVRGGGVQFIRRCTGSSSSYQYSCFFHCKIRIIKNTKINDNFLLRAAMHGASLPWIPSPMQGVHRRMLDRIGDEVARATTIVKFDPNSEFSAHTHDGGEEYITLEGAFQDEAGDFPVGSYVRNPPTSSHTPRSEPGCVIFVKLWQFDPNDRKHININMNDTPFQTTNQDGVDVMPLFQDSRENVRLERWAPGVTVTIDATGGAECLVLGGSFRESGEVFEKHSWLRVPKDYQLTAEAGENGARVWIKSGHLDYVIIPPANKAVPIATTGIDNKSV